MTISELESLVDAFIALVDATDAHLDASLEVSA